MDRRVLSSVLFRAAVLATLIPVSGCKSTEFGFDQVPFVSPSLVELSPGGVQTFDAGIVEGTFDDVTWSVREGPAGGAIVPEPLPARHVRATYTSPASPGTFHVDARFQQPNGGQRSAFATVVVR